MYLDELTIISTETGYGDVGLRGELGYEGKRVSVGSRPLEHAISAHPPARLRFALPGGRLKFSCSVGLNDDVPPGLTQADFTVRVDGFEVASLIAVQPGEVRQMDVAVSGNVLDLEVSTNSWQHCHAVWMDPTIDVLSPPELVKIVDCLNRAQITIPLHRQRFKRCIASVVSAGFESLLDDMLGSLTANGRCEDAQTVVFVFDNDAKCVQVAEKYGATVIPCRAVKPLGVMSKALLYSAVRVIDADAFVCLDADLVVLGSLRPIFEAIEALPPQSILACREGNGTEAMTLAGALQSIYQAESDAGRVFRSPAEAGYSLVVNDGVFAGSRSAMLALDGEIRNITWATEWIGADPKNWWRNQFIFNLALARLRVGVELDGSYNVQLHVQDVAISDDHRRLRANWRNREVKILHLNGNGRTKHALWGGRFARVPDPVGVAQARDAYQEFLSALRSWIGRHGRRALAWSFYGTTNGVDARIPDPMTFPLLACLHYLIRSNGCARVLETGTARGISAACIASAVAHRQNGRVVSLDPFAFEERFALWAALPEFMRKCIESRTVGSLEGMSEAVAAGEQYDAALLDSVHTAEHVLAEFQLASKLVRPGGLILIHDVRFAWGTVDQAVRQIENDGYNVVRLWGADSAVAEDDNLGLAIIDNRRRAASSA
jgi:predicted O-methyltransferase YrrM